MESNFISARNVRLSLKDLAEEIMGELNVPSDYLPKIHEFLTKNVNDLRSASNGKMFFI